MRKLITCLATFLLVGTSAFAELSYRNQRLDHALYPKHLPRLVVAGQIEEIKGHMYEGRELLFQVDEVILGARALAHTRITVPTAAFRWPEDLVRHAVGSFCILVLDKKTLLAVAPAAKGNIRAARNQVEALRIIEERIIDVLRSETSASRQEAILRQLAPVLRRDNTSSVAPFLRTRDEWVRRAAVAALTYATEEYGYIRLAAADIKSFFASETVAKCVEQKRRALACEPASEFMENYFFIQSDSWRWGSRWDDEEAAKHLRIWRAILSTGEVPVESAKMIGGQR